MNWELIRLFPDFGLVVLVFIVQLAIYPSFRYFSGGDLDAWHSRYTGRISYIVMPLMLSQIIINGAILYQELTFLNFGSFGLIIAIWILTFFRAIPLHNSLINLKSRSKNISSLIRLNAWRCLLWTLVFILNVYSFLA